MKHGPSLVAPPDNRTSSPVANGSSMTAWPVRAPVLRRSSATSANDDGPAGLSTRTIPTGLRARGGISAILRVDCSRELPVYEGNDLLEGLLAREPGRLTVASAARLPRDR